MLELMAAETSKGNGGVGVVIVIVIFVLWWAKK